MVIFSAKSIEAVNVFCYSFANGKFSDFRTFCANFSTVMLFPCFPMKLYLNDLTYVLYWWCSIFSNQRSEIAVFNFLYVEILDRAPSEWDLISSDEEHWLTTKYALASQFSVIRILSYWLKRNDQLSNKLCKKSLGGRREDKVCGLPSEIIDDMVSLFYQGSFPHTWSAQHEHPEDMISPNIQVSR